MDFEQIWALIATAVAVILIPIVNSLVGDADPERVRRWGIAKQFLLRIFTAVSTRSSKTGEQKVSVPLLQSPVHPDDR